MWVSQVPEKWPFGNLGRTPGRLYCGSKALGEGKGSKGVRVKASGGVSSAGCMYLYTVHRNISFCKQGVGIPLLLDRVLHLLALSI